MFDINKAKAEAEKEFAEERMNDAKSKIKAKLKQLDAAKKVVANLQRELDDLYTVISQDL